MNVLLVGGVIKPSHYFLYVHVFLYMPVYSTLVQQYYYINVQLILIVLILLGKAFFKNIIEKIDIINI